MKQPKIKYKRQPKIKYREYDNFRSKKGKCEGAAGTAFGKYVSKLDATNLYEINDAETKTTYKLGLGERRAFGDAHRDFGICIKEWFDSLAKAAQERIIRIPLDNEMKEIKEE